MPTVAQPKSSVFRVVHCPLKGILRSPIKGDPQLPPEGLLPRLVQSAVQYLPTVVSQYLPAWKISDPPTPLETDAQNPTENILEENVFLNIFEETVRNNNKYVIAGYQFINLYLMDCIERNGYGDSFPEINMQFISDALKTVGSGRKNMVHQTNRKNAVNTTRKLDFNRFYNNVFSELISCDGYEEPSFFHNSHVLPETAKEMLTGIENNISAHFVTYVERYINLFFKIPKEKEIKKIKNNEKKEKMKQIRKKARGIKQAIIKGDINLADPEYRPWIRENRIFLHPPLQSIEEFPPL